MGGQQLLPQHLHSRADGLGSWQAHGAWTDRARDSLNVHGDPELMIQDTKPKLLLKNAQAHMEKMMQLLVTNKYHFPLISLQEPVPLLFVFFFLSCTRDLQTAVLKLKRANKYRDHLFAGYVHQLVAEIPEQMIRGFFFFSFKQRS